MDIAGFLRRYSPFDALTPERLDEVAGSVEIEHFPAGTVILQQGGDPAAALYVVRKGAVELLDDGHVLDLLVEGEVFGQFSLLAHEVPSLSVRAQEDTLCYLIPEDIADPVLESHAGLTFVIGSMRRRIASATDAAVDVPDARLTMVGSLVRRAPVTAPPETPTSAAAERMAAERVSSLLVPMRDGWGIVTDRDLRTRIVAARADLGTPLEVIATFPVRTLPHDTLAGEALLRMFAQGVHHFPVTGPTGEVLGVVTDTDLMGLGRHTPFAAKSAIERASSSEEVAAAGRELPDLVVAMVRGQRRPDRRGPRRRPRGRRDDRAADRPRDRRPRRPAMRVGVARARQRRPPRAGAAHRPRPRARLRPGAGRAADAEPYFAELAERVTAGLEAAGIPRCEGDAMAVHPTLRRPLGEFAEAFVTWMDSHDPHSTVLSSIGYDFRRVSGPLDAEPVLDAAIRVARARPAFVRQMARRALDPRPPTGFLRDLVVEGRGEHAGRLDVKHRGITIVNNLARVWALRAGVTTKDTRGRLRSAAAAGTIRDTVATELIDAFHFLWDVRLTHQAQQVTAGETPDDFVDPATLGSFSRSGLKEAFRVIGRAQRQLATEEGSSQARR